MEKQLIETLLNQYKLYSSVNRASIQPHKLKLADISNLKTDHTSHLIAESLLEHVGHLPITAVTLYPYLNNEDVKLGDALIMLAIHDIGELETGDTAIFLKTKESAVEEKSAALNMLDDSFHPYYLDMEEQKTPTGKFAKSIDKIVPDVLDLLVEPQISIKRYESMNITKDQIATKKREKKLQYMTWNPFLEKFYNILLNKVDEYYK